MDRTSGSERDEEEEEEEREREKGGTCWSAFYTHLGEVERKSVWLRREKDLWSHQPWWMDVTCSVWSFSAAFYIWYLILIAQQRAQQNTLPWWKPPMVKKCDVRVPADRNIGWNPSSGKRVDAVSVYLSYELYSLLWWYLRASDQQFPGRHRELSDW